MERRVTIQWTRTAVAALKKLPRKVQDGLRKKIGSLEGCDPREPNKPLAGPLRGYFRVPYGRYRAIYSVKTEPVAGRAADLHFTVICVVVGLRKEGDRKDIYNLAKRLVELGIIEADSAGAAQTKKDKDSSDHG